jgi:hypothetical protein
MMPEDAEVKAMNYWLSIVNAAISQKVGFDWSKGSRKEIKSRKQVYLQWAQLYQLGQQANFYYQQDPSDERAHSLFWFLKNQILDYGIQMCRIMGVSELPKEFLEWMDLNFPVAEDEDE